MFQLQFPEDEIEHWASRWQETKYVPKQAAALAAGNNLASGRFTREEFEMVCGWKSERRLDLLRNNQQEVIEEAVGIAKKVKDSGLAIAVLTGLSGVQAGMGSALLTAMKPMCHTVIDFRALHALGVIRDPSSYLRLYPAYLNECRSLRDRLKVDLRKLDNALWAWSLHQPPPRI